MTPLLTRLARHLVDHEAPLTVTVDQRGDETWFVAASEWGKEADDSPMIGAAAYGLERTLDGALENLLDQAGYPAGPADLVTPDELAAYFHTEYERMAPSFGYETREASAVPWDQVPEQNRRLMGAVAASVLMRYLPDRMAVPHDAPAGVEAGS